MTTKHLKSISTAKKVAFFICCLCIISVIVFDKIFLEISIFREGWPTFSIGDLMRSTIIFISTIGIFYSMVGIQKPIFLISERKGASFELASIIMVLFISVITLSLFMFNPSTFNKLSKEDNVIEWGSAILLFGSFLFSGLTMLNYHRSSNNLSFVKLFIGLMSLAFFIIFMEEVSWFQRVLEVKTPESFGSNVQDEMNLHNFATEFTEYAYYLGAFVFLVIFPFFRFIFPTISSNDFLKIIAPRPFIGIIGSICCS